MEKPKVENKTGSLFEVFDRAGKRAWLETVTKDFGETDFGKALIWKTDDGFDVQPMYFAEDTENIEHEGFVPGTSPFVRGTSILENKEKAWTISQVITAPKVSRANEELTTALDRGHTGAQLIIDLVPDSKQNAFAPEADDSDSERVGRSGITIGDEEDLSKLLDGVDVQSCELTFDAGNSTPALLAMFRNILAKREMKSDNVNAVFPFDPLSRLASDGRLPWSEQEMFNLCEQTMNYTREHLPAARCLSVDGHVFHDSGASGSDEVALSLSCGVEYVRQMLERGVDLRDVAVSLRFSFAAGTSFFPEIAKLRAARMLWAKIMHHICAADQETPGADDSCLKMDMHVAASWWNQTAFDPYVNMLRGTIEAMSAAIGGGRTITTLPFDGVSAAAETFSERIAGNTQIILQEEAYLTEVVDPSSGSYYIETLTENMAKQAWARFREIEKNGGYLESLKSGTVQQLLEETAAEKQQRISDLSDVLVGTNKYQNPDELPDMEGDADTDSIEPAAGADYSRVSSDPEQKNLEVRAIPRMRLAEKFEREQRRKKTDQEGNNV